jgi:hypothetical protein
MYDDYQNDFPKNIMYMRTGNTELPGPSYLRRGDVKIDRCGKVIVSLNYGSEGRSMPRNQFNATDVEEASK